MSGKYAKLLLFWGILFGIAVGITLISWQSLASSGDGRPPGIIEPPPEEGEGEGGTGSINLILGVLTALTSAGGFIVTTIFALREDRRDSTMHQLQIEQLKREIEQKDLELDEMRQEKKDRDKESGAP